MKNNFPKSERLCSKKTIEALFDRKNPANDGFLVYPIRVVFQRKSDDLNETIPISNPQILCSVSKRNFKHAVDRNLVRRRIKESYRLHKNSLLKIEKSPTVLAFIYVAKEIVDYSVIEKSMIKILKKFG